MNVSETLKQMAELAWEHNMKGPSLKRNSLLVPVAMLFDQVRVQKPILDREAQRAAAIEQIYDHLDRISERGRGKKTKEAAEKMANLFFHTLLEENYSGKVHRLVSDEKTIKSAYLFYIRSNIQKKEGNE